MFQKLCFKIVMVIFFLLESKLLTSDLTGGLFDGFKLLGYKANPEGGKYVPFCDYSVCMLCIGTIFSLRWWLQYIQEFAKSFFHLSYFIQHVDRLCCKVLSTPEYGCVRRVCVVICYGNP